jgi:hypothetical protein
MCIFPTVKPENFRGRRTRSGETQTARWRTICKRLNSAFDWEPVKAFRYWSDRLNPSFVARLQNLVEIHVSESMHGKIHTWQRCLLNHWQSQGMYPHPNYTAHEHIDSDASLAGLLTPQRQ